MIAVSLFLENQPVLVVGNGRQAHRKISQLLEEKANITVIAPNIDEKIEGVTYIEDTYQEKYIEDMFYVIAATNDEIINSKIVADCSKNHTLVSSMTKSNANCHMMSTYESDTLLVGYNTHGLYPGYNDVLRKEIQQIDERHHDKIYKLSLLRPYFLKMDNKRSLLKQLCNLKEETLDYLYLLIVDKVNKPILLFQSYKKDVDILNDELDDYFICQNGLQGKYEDIQLLYPILDALQLPVVIIPLVLFDGFIYQKMKVSFETEHIHVAGPLIQNKKDLDRLINTYVNDEHTLLVTHPRKSNAYEYPLQACSFLELEEIDWDNIHSVIPFLLVEGGHYFNDIVGKVPNNVIIQPVLLKNKASIQVMKEIWKINEGVSK